jgi:competence protein ComEC
VLIEPVLSSVMVANSLRFLGCATDFQRIGASGFVLGSIRTVEAPHAPGLRLRFSMLVDGTREAIDKRIRTILPGDNGAIASALITGKRDTISTPVNKRCTCRASPMCLDLRLSHGRGGRHHVLYAARAVCAHAGLR